MLASRAIGCNERRCAAEEARLPGPGLELIGEEEIAEVVGVLRSGFLSRYGPDDDPAFCPRVRHFEQEVARLTGVAHALAVNSGSSGIWLALAGLGIGPRDEGVVPGFTLMGSASGAMS